MTAGPGAIDHPALARTAARVLGPSPDSTWTAPAGVVIGVRTPDATFIHVAGERVPADGSRGRPAAPMTPSTVHDLASVTKTMTTTAVMRLIAVGALGLDDDVRAYVPTFPHPASIRQLLLHRAGLWEWWPLYVRSADPVAAWAELDSLPARYPAESGRHYSDLGFMLLGRVLEAVSGTGLRDAMARLVTDPLGLTRTGYGPRQDAEIAAGSYGDAAERRMLATSTPYPVPYSDTDMDRWRDGLVVGAANDGNTQHALHGVSGHAGLFAPVPDLLAFAHALSTGEHRLAAPDVAAAFFADGPDPGQALGWRTGTLGLDGHRHAFVYHPGFTGVTVGFVPGQGVAVVVAANRLVTPGEPIPNDTLLRIVADALAPPGALTPTGHATGGTARPSTTARHP
ncbi:serine hydrolase domain-containing protein [Phytoactinopolyspora halotolerans]|uniref:Beta-lactamase family protein n=1 Tax=Phytoactinopolyspora halotolerans TaxID=1981512 RepID=A0A6L9SHY8_9ACTN|nr:serine hydrolase domain-containing protein [Phytoactinopolyspora halotolerans]NEE04737.1 beta-lactamase family protein [Phytoactinopolyspora halotolerans]